MDDSDRLALGREAEALMLNSAFKAARDNYRASLLDAFAKTAPGDVTAWTLLHTKLEVLKGIEGELGAMRTNGVVALTNLRKKL